MYKKAWAGIIGVIRSHGRYSISTSPSGHAYRAGYSYQVRVAVSVQGGREDGRVVEIWMTPEEAESHAQDLLSAAKQAAESQTAL